MSDEPTLADVKRLELDLADMARATRQLLDAVAPKSGRLNPHDLVRAVKYASEVLEHYQSQRRYS